MDPVIAGHNVVLLLFVVALRLPCFVSIFDDLSQVVLLDCCKNCKEEVPLWIVGGALVFVWEISSYHWICQGFFIEVLD